jgi:hypothetical protein
VFSIFIGLLIKGRPLISNMFPFMINQIVC